MRLLELVFYTKRGKNRLLILKILDKPMMPSEIAVKIFGKTTNTSFNLVSRALSELKTKELVRVLNPGEKTGRIYEYILGRAKSSLEI